MVLSQEYKKEVLALNKSPLYASLKWLKNIGAIEQCDLETFDHIKRCRNTLAHEMLKFTSSGVDFDVAEAFEQMTSLIRKIEMWWFENFEMEIDPDAYPDDLNLDEVVPGSIMSIKMLIDIALGPEEAIKYYECFVAHAEKI